MTISISDARPAHGTVHPHDVFRRVVHSTLTTGERFMIVEGPAGSGKTHALAEIAAAARVDGHGVVQLRSAGGDLVTAASSLESLVALVQHAATTTTSVGEPGRSGRTSLRRRQFVLVDDFHHLAESARATLRAVMESLVRSTGTVCVVAVDDRRSVPGWSDLQYVPLSPLSRAQAQELLRHARVDLPAARMSMLLRVAAGNPSLLHTIGRAWAAESPADRSSTFPKSYPALGDRVGSAAETVDALALAEREAALVLAVASVEFPNDGDLWVSSDEGPLDPPLENLLSRAGTATLDPLVRAHLLSTASLADLRRVRCLIAASGGVSERLRVLAEASVAARDDHLVPRLVVLVDESLRLRRPDDAVAALLEAARLTSSDARRGQLRARAAAMSAFIGDFALVDAEAERMADRAEPVPPLLTAAIEFGRAVRTGEIRECRRAVLAALDVSTGADEEDALIATLHVLCFLRSDESWWDEALMATAGRDIDPVLRLVEDCLRGPASDEQHRALYREAQVSVADGQPWKAVALHVAWSLLCEQLRSVSCF